MPKENITGTPPWIAGRRADRWHDGQRRKRAGRGEAGQTDHPCRIRQRAGAIEATGYPTADVLAGPTWARDSLGTGRYRLEAPEPANAAVLGGPLRNARLTGRA